MSLLKRSPDHIHFIGIGGSGMSGLAEVLFNLGYTVTGSDISTTLVTERLTSLGIDIQSMHKASNLGAAEMVVVSTAIDEKNPEVVEAKKLMLPVLARAELLSSLMNMKRGIAVSGTHGKTTTTSILASIMTEAMLDPTFIIGGVINSFATNAKLGSGNYLIAEADESDKSFLMLHPSLEIITNIDADHLGNYEHDMLNLEKAFVDFVKKLPFNGLLIACGDDPVVKRLIPEFTRTVITYGFEDSNDYMIIDYASKELTSEFLLRNKLGNEFKILLNLPGKHNALNAAAASILALEEGISVLNIQSALEKFSGIGRRMESLGEIIQDDKKTMVIDDYGHHPTELKCTIDAIRESFPKQKITMVFQPHRYSRTKDLYKEFVDVLNTVDQLVLLNIYAAGEQKIRGVSAYNLMEDVKKKGLKEVNLAESDSVLFQNIREIVGRSGGVLLMQGAGDISNLSGEILQKFT
tara:strand:+ start:6454 stop:7851 length:1398 start_codon:yes stop_codon:yes gene_type:complete